MRTLLDASFPPTCMEEATFSPPERQEQAPRIFSQSVVLAKVDNLVEVGVGGTVIATPSASHADPADDALDRGGAFSSADIEQPKEGVVSV
jgi:hypothetical protein